MNLRNTMKLACLLPLALSFACGAAGDAGEASESATEADGTPEVAEMNDVVATADVGYGTVYFHEQTNEDGTVAIGVSESLPGNYGMTPVQRLFVEGHTNLEVFMALLPNLEAPASFVDAHKVQSEQLGRDNDAIREAVFDANAPIEKSVTWCRGIATPEWVGEREYTYSGRKSLDDVKGSQSIALAAGKKPVAPAICNERSASKSASHTVQGRVRVKQDGGSYNSPGWTVVIGPGGAWQWHGLQLLDYSYCADLPDNSLCLGRAVNATYKLEGKSNTTSVNNWYDLYIAKIDSVIDHTVIK